MSLDREGKIVEAIQFYQEASKKLIDLLGSNKNKKLGKIIEDKLNEYLTRAAYLKKKRLEQPPPPKERQELHRELENDQIEKLRKIIKVSESMEISQLAIMLDMDENQVLKRLVNWADQFGFIIRGKEVIFNKDTADSFIATIDKQYASWDKKTQDKDGKV